MSEAPAPRGVAGLTVHVREGYEIGGAKLDKAAGVLSEQGLVVLSRRRDPATDDGAAPAELSLIHI